MIFKGLDIQSFVFKYYLPLYCILEFHKTCFVFPTLCIIHTCNGDTLRFFFRSNPTFLMKLIHVDRIYFHNLYLTNDIPIRYIDR